MALAASFFGQDAVRVKDDALGTVSLAVLNDFRLRKLIFGLRSTLMERARFLALHQFPAAGERVHTRFLSDTERYAKRLQVLEDEAKKRGFNV